MAMNAGDRRVDPDLRDRIDDAMLDAARDAARRTALIAAGGYFLLLLVLLVGAVFYQRATNHRLDSSERRACERLQAQRERSNVGDARQYLILTEAVKNPATPRRIRARFTSLANTTLFDPPTDCDAAVARPGAYRRPPAIPFYALPREFTESVVRAARDKRPQPVLPSSP